MVFVPIKNIFYSWLSSDKFKKVFQGRQVVSWANKYFIENKKWPSHVVKANSFNQGRLVIQCFQGVISSELRLEESQLRKYLKEKMPKIQVKKIFYKIK
ncbi:MAG: DciA family protein [Candidatus Pacebacteria bacterium]|jgi:CRISPR/Cas system endoribonuclease Cas6 (RAMP superfamily)|nr:DciA family protein [Candidatus Paceibacterota bacterium]MDD4994491.1 DciA family protein [Candidatus Paceibacterota bacterium]MDD5535404.1 DciA family protein [Candidatus Paceibacterota bacterium]